MTITTEQKAAAAEMADWDLIVAALHWNGELHSCLDENEALLVYSLADGYGRAPLAELMASIGWDWSHIRDSSDDACKTMAATIRGLLGS